jgi:hypothetical protein
MASTVVMIAVSNLAEHPLIRSNARLTGKQQGPSTAPRRGSRDPEAAGTRTELVAGDQARAR